MRVWRLAAVPVLVAGLAGCSAGADEKPRAVPTLGTPSASASASPVVVATPSGIAAPTPAGATAFVRYFYAQISKGFAERDPSVVRVLSDPACRTCDRYVQSLARLRDRHETATPVRFDLTFAEAPATDGRSARVDVIFNYSGVKRFDASGRLIHEEKPLKEVAETLTLVRRGNSWAVKEVVG